MFLQASFSHFQGLDERINLVATKVVHLGDQLEGVNTPRARAYEAQRLMNYLSEFLTDEPPKSAIFTDPFQVKHTLARESFPVVWAGYQMKVVTRPLDKSA